jgi:hypothetical protein
MWRDNSMEANQDNVVVFLVCVALLYREYNKRPRKPGEVGSKERLALGCEGERSLFPIISVVRIAYLLHCCSCVGSVSDVYVPASMWR